jgi:hypothetical protein
MANENQSKPAKHTCNDGHGPVFGRKTPGCPRCDQLLAGAKPVRWAQPTPCPFGCPAHHRCNH